MAGCSGSTEPLFSASGPETDAARRAIEQLRRGELEALEAQLAAELVGPDTRTGLERLAALFPAGEPAAVTVVGQWIRTRNGARQTELSYEYAYPAAWIVVSLGLQSIDGQPVIHALNAQVLPESLATLNRFDLGRQGLLGYAFATLAIAILVFVLVVFVICLRTPIPRRKWLWAIFVLVGFKPLGMMLLGAAAVAAGPYAPWVISFAAPFGAIAFLARRRAWLKEESGPPATAGSGGPERQGSHRTP